MQFRTSLLAVAALSTFASAVVLPFDFPTFLDDDEVSLLEMPTLHLPDSGEIVGFPLAFDGGDFKNLEDTGSAAFADWKTQVVQLHNQYRAHYGAGPVTWSDALYPGTNQWAHQCKFEHSHGNGYGENLAAGTGGGYGFPNGMKSWMDEASKYDYNHPGFSHGTGHFTQVVWKSSKHVACALAKCGAGTIFKQESNYLVCRYDPPGNFIGRFPENVGRPQ